MTDTFHQPLENIRDVTTTTSQALLPRPIPCISIPLHYCHKLVSSRIVLAHHFRRLHSIHLLGPARCRLELPDCSDLVKRITRNTYVVVALKDDLDVADIEGGIRTNLS